MHNKINISNENNNAFWTDNNNNVISCNFFNAVALMQINKVKREGKFLYTAESDHQNFSERFTLYCLADLFNRIACRLL